jgi:L-alanine-DL-glutamate epimerase-like enolase superfamily enzyme
MHTVATLESWPLKRPFSIARLTITDTVTLYVRLTEAGVVGHGESEPYDYARETQLRLQREVGDAAEHLSLDVPWQRLRELLPQPSARNPVDCALWDLRAKLQGVSIWKLAGVARPHGPLTTAMTVSVDTPEKMQQQASELRQCRLIKIKVDGGDDVTRVAAVREVTPSARLTVDANESWSFAQLREFAPELAKLGVEMIEQPLHTAADEQLLGYRSPVPLCADEACIDVGSLPQIVGRYQMVNVKLDKTGGFTEGLMLVREARRLGLGVMTGCNVGTSLAMAPAFLIGTLSDFVDLDGAAMLARDREPGLVYDLNVGTVEAPTAALWG